MKKTLFLGSLILTSSFALANGTYAASLKGKGINHLPKTTSGSLDRRGAEQNESISPKQENTTIIKADRATRIAENQAKSLEQRKVKIQKKIRASESLTRLEKKFANANGIDY